VDKAIERWINSLADHTGWAHGFFVFYASAGIVLLAVLLAVAAFDARRNCRLVSLAGCINGGIAALVALGIGQIIGNAVDRPRPYTAIPDLHVLVHRSSDFSFPSDHATVAGAVAVALLLCSRRIGLVAAGAALLMAWTRVYVGAHYVSDVLAGLALGGLTAWLGWVTLVPLITRVLAAIERTPLRWLVAPSGASRRSEPVYTAARQD
jgi:membrane-associated phospholipid phosphatase